MKGDFHSIKGAQRRMEFKRKSEVRIVLEEQEARELHLALCNTIEKLQNCNCNDENEAPLILTKFKTELYGNIDD